MVEGVVERKHWMQAILDDLVLLTWTGTTEAEVTARAGHDLDALHAALNTGSERLDGNGQVMVCAASACLGTPAPEPTPAARRLRLRTLLGQDL